MRLRALLLAVLALLPLAAAAPVVAQSLTDTRAMVVSSCGAQAFPLTIGGAQAYAPLTMLQNGTLCTVAGSGGGGSTTLSLPAPVTMTVTNMSISAGGTSTFPANGNRKYLTFVNSTPGPCRYGYSNGGAAPTATTGMPIAAGQFFTLEASSISRQAVPFYCAQAGTIDITEGQ